MAIALIGALELGARLYRTQNAPGIVSELHPAYSDPPWAKQYLQDISLLTGSAYRSKPYVPYSLWKEHPFKSETITIENNGYRKTILPVVNRTDQKVTIFLFGGSTLFSAQVPDPLTIPSILARELHKTLPAVQLDIRNFGIDGFLSTQEVHLLIELLLAGEQPDLVIFYDGVNDFFHRVVANIPHTFYERFLGALDRKAAFNELLHSFLRRSALAESTGLVRTQYPTDPDLIVKRTEKMLAAYQNQMQLVETLAKTYSFQPLFFWQTNLFTTAKKQTAYEKRLYKAQNPALINCVTIAQPIITTFIREAQKIHDCTDCLDRLSETVFTDPYHVTHQANERIASRILAQIIPLLP